VPIVRHSLARAGRRQVAQEANLNRALDLARAARYAGVRGGAVTADSLMRELRRVPNVWQWRYEGKRWLGDWCPEVKQELSV
jgi:hypothetical protein